MRGWAVIIRKRQLTEVRGTSMRTASGIIEWFSTTARIWISRPGNRRPGKTARSPEADKRVAEEASVPSDSVAAEADESRDPGEPAGTSASAAN